MQGRPSMSGMRWRVAASILIGVGWLGFVLLYAAFWSGPYSLFQSIVIVLVSFILLAGMMGAMWASWGCDSPVWECRRSGRRPSESSTFLYLLGVRAPEWDRGRDRAEPAGRTVGERNWTRDRRQEDHGAQRQ